MTEKQLELQVSVSGDRMQASVDGAALADVSPDERTARVEAELDRLGVPPELRPEDLRERLAALAGRAGPIVVAHGLEPVEPIDASIEWAGDFFRIGFRVDPATGTMDYRQHVAHNEVKDGALLATVTPGQPGTDGRDLRGKTVKVRKPVEVKISAGTHVRQDGERFFATASGRVRFDAGILAVDDILTIDGDVGLRTGHINHHGAVIVTNDILAGSRVEADGDLEVRGVVETSEIKVGGDLVVHGGVTGSDGLQVEVAGNVRARFLLDVDLTAGGDVVVEREVLHSNVVAAGSVDVSGGRVVGGSISAAGGATLLHVGSEAEVATRIEAGNSPELTRRMRAIRARLRALHKRREEIERVVVPVAARVDSLPALQREAVDRLAEELEQIDRNLVDVAAELERIRQEAATRVKHEVIVNGQANPASEFVLRGESMRLKSALLGPFRIAWTAGEIVMEPIEPEDDDPGSAGDA